LRQRAGILRRTRHLAHKIQPEQPLEPASGSLVVRRHSGDDRAGVADLLVALPALSRSWLCAGESLRSARGHLDRLAADLASTGAIQRPLDRALVADPAHARPDP